ncbi:hypothetical protein P691DRAFT_810446 [Macrolepiota fuliginosa MF-IS2]|uniref:Uncharacterized protein n=1 Tax=Macrolepiota fuliginosa MF-IS2 TaxID=1400762 RepID=A0A9P5XGN9_9AGAR|nr:hypothetical protein P691DRAFT_810446 [Macrolepiota fuliginosa MF-IS2]
MKNKQRGEHHWFYSTLLVVPPVLKGGCESKVLSHCCHTCTLVLEVPSHILLGGGNTTVELEKGYGIGNCTGAVPMAASAQSQGKGVEIHALCPGVEPTSVTTYK